MTNYFELFDKRLHAIEERQSAILALLNEAGPETSGDEETPLSLEQAAEFLGIAPQTVYQNIKKIPRRKRFGRLYFFKSELRDYLKGGEPV